MNWKNKINKFFLPSIIAVGIGLLILSLGLGLLLLKSTQPIGYRINTIVGNGMPGYAGDENLAYNAKLKHPRGLFVDKVGNLYIADAENDRVRKVDIKTGIITTIAGGGSQTVSCNKDAKPITATEVLFDEPVSVAVDNRNNVYILINTACIYKVTDGYLIPFIGSEQPGYNGDGDALGAAIDPQYGDISLDYKNEYLYIADRDNHCIRKVNLQNAPHKITTVAGRCGEPGYDDEKNKEKEATNVRLFQPEDVVLDKAGNMYIADTANLVIRYVDKETNLLTTIAGKNGIKKHGGDNGPATEATFAHPIDLVIDNSDELYIVDQESHRIRHIDNKGIIRTIAGNGKQTYSGDGGDATEASLNHPKDIALISESDGSFIGLYVSDKRNHRIRKIERKQTKLPNWLRPIADKLGLFRTGYKIETFAGTGQAGFSGDGGPAREAQVQHARGIAQDKAGNLYLADTENHRIRKIDAKTHNITTFAGCEKGKDKEGKDTICEKWEQWVSMGHESAVLATQMQLNMPSDVAIDKAGNLYILDHVSYRVYQVDTKGFIKPFAGNGSHGYRGDGGPAIEANINPTYSGIAVDHKGNLYIADRFNHRIRQVNEQGIITTVAGNGEQGYKGDGGKAIAAQLNLPEDITVDEDGNLYIADSYNHIIRKVDIENNITTIAGIPGQKGYSGDGGPATEAKLSLPVNLAIDKAGNLYIADFHNDVIRHMNREGIITTIAGTAGKPGDKGDGGLATKASFFQPEAIVLSEATVDGLPKVIYINDKGNFRIRKLVWNPKIGDYDYDYYFLLILSVLGFTLFIGISLALYYLRLYRHPIVQALYADPSQLLTTPLEQLPKAKDLLQRTHRLDTVLTNNEVPSERLDNAINFVTMSNAERCALLKRLFNLRSVEPLTDEIFQLDLSEEFPLKLRKCQVYFPPTDLPTQDVFMPLEKDDMSLQVTVVISLVVNQQSKLRPMGENLDNLWVVPNSRELTALLLSSQPQKALAHLLASQLAITNISPYQTSAGITKDSVFFGRNDILQIFNREPKNYLFVGGRQLGKSSLLKKVVRRYQNHPKVKCIYLSLLDDSTRQLNEKMGLAQEAPLPELLDKLVEVPNGERRLILIDEADAFIRSEITNGYPTLNKFRSVSEEGRCHFFLAGFWDLYYAMTLDYHSPIRNFGEFFMVLRLEREACRELATQPMALLGLRYEHEELVEQLITATGQRANLVAIVCDEMLKHLPIERRVLNTEDVTKALHSWAVEEALSGWGQLSHNEQIDHLARIIIYATVEPGEFSLTDVMNVLNTHDYVYTTEQLKQSLKCLELAYLIQRDKGRYSYCVPLFREWLLEDDVKALLRQELKS
jgi:sugar lactone lactonase YvrE